MWMCVLVGVLLLAIHVLLAWAWQRRHFAYWQRLCIPYIPATPFLGNVKNLLFHRCCFGEQFRQLYEAPEARHAAFVGIHVLHNHALLLRDPALIQRVLVSDFGRFNSRFETTDCVGDPLGSLNLFFAKYDVWKDIHKIFTPFFAAGKVKQMYELLQQIGVQLELHMSQLSHKVAATSNFEADRLSTVVEVKQMCALFTTDLIASLAFGIKARSLQNPNAEFRRMCIEVNEPRPARILHLFTMFFFPKFVRKVGAHLYSGEYERFMRESINYVMEQRENKGNTGTQRNDLIDIFLQLKHSYAADSVVHQPDFFVAQAAFLLLAGFDTSSSTITFTLYELAKQPLLQHKLRAELQEALLQDEGVLSFDTLNGMQYLRMVVDEVLRLYPPTSFLDRCCNAERGFELISEGLRVPAGMPVYISVLGLQRDAQYWPEPHKFQPERFSVEQRSQHTPMTYLPFGAGPRGCIGTILGLLEVKVGLVHILRNYFVEPCTRTVPEMKLDPKTFVLAPDGGTYLNFVKDELYAKKTL